jgi:hypothetical protein
LRLVVVRSFLMVPELRSGKKGGRQEKGRRGASVVLYSFWHTLFLFLSKSNSNFLLLLVLLNNNRSDRAIHEFIFIFLLLLLFYSRFLFTEREWERTMGL